jgi:hypothetical protein
MALDVDIYAIYIKNAVGKSRGGFDYVSGHRGRDEGL